MPAVFLPVCISPRHPYITCPMSGMSFLGDLGADPPGSWVPLVFLLIIAIGFAIVNVAASVIIGPSRTGPGKETTYESGMIPVGDTRRRFNVRFYIVAMIFLVFDVEIVFLYPWATIFSPSVQQGGNGGLLL